MHVDATDLNMAFRVRGEYGEVALGSRGAALGPLRVRVVVPQPTRITATATSEIEPFMCCEQGYRPSVR